jgi:putative transposase
MLTLVVNMLLEWESGSIERVLWIDPSGADLVAIDVTGAAAWPTFYPVKAIQIALDDATVRVLDTDPYMTAQPESSIPVTYRQRRDQAWKVVRPLIETGRDIFITEKRGALVATAVQQTGHAKTTIYGYLRRYWQGGQTRNALLPRFHRCGAPGQVRPDTDQKRGRPSSLENAAQKRMGINVDDHIRDCFRAGIRLFYETRQARSLTDTDIKN